MIALVQRVLEASVTVEGVETARIGAGTLALVGVERSDTAEEAARLAERLLAFRMFADEAGRMNLDVLEAEGALLLVPQFTLAADTRRGRRPGFSSAAGPERATALFDAFHAHVEARAGETRSGTEIRTGTFGAHMRVASINDGPVTFRLRVPPSGAGPASEDGPAA